MFVWKSKESQHIFSKSSKKFHLLALLLPSHCGQNWTDGIYSITDLWQLKRICWQKLIRDDLILPAVQLTGKATPNTLASAHCFKIAVNLTDAVQWDKTGYSNFVAPDKVCCSGKCNVPMLYTRTLSPFRRKSPCTVETPKVTFQKQKICRVSLGASLHPSEQMHT